MQWPGLQAEVAGGVGSRQVGDGLVALDSALGRHPDPQRYLKVPDHHQWVGRGVNHIDLLDHPRGLRDAQAVGRHPCRFLIKGRTVHQIGAGPQFEEILVS